MTTTRVLGIPSGPNTSYDADLPPGPMTIVFQGDWYPLNVPSDGGTYHFLELIPDYAALAMAQVNGVVTQAYADANYLTQSQADQNYLPTFEEASRPALEFS